MGQIPAKTFPTPAAYGQSAGVNTLQQAQMAPLAPPQQFMGLGQFASSNPAAPATSALQNATGPAPAKTRLNPYGSNVFNQLYR